MNLYEATKAALITASKTKGPYKKQTFGKNRWERKKLSKISNANQAFNKIDMNMLFKQDTLLVNIPVIGETDSYEVSVKFTGIIEELAKLLKTNNYIFEYKLIIQAVTKILNLGDAYIKCTCSDYKYRYKHWNIINKVDIDGTDKDPGPGKGIANPQDDLGRGCKHSLLVLANLDWIMKVSSVINNYINYAATKLQKPFLNVIFPKIYGVDSKDAVSAQLVEKDEDLTKNPKNLLTVVNTWRKSLKSNNKSNNN